MFEDDFQLGNFKPDFVAKFKNLCVGVSALVFPNVNLILSSTRWINSGFCKIQKFIFIFRSTSNRDRSSRIMIFMIDKDGQWTTLLNDSLKKFSQIMSPQLITETARYPAVSKLEIVPKASFL